VHGAQAETVTVLHLPAVGSITVSHTVLQQVAWKNPQISPSPCGWKLALILWVIRVEMNRVHLASQDVESGNILYLLLMGSPWISRHSYCRLCLMNNSSLQKCHDKSFSQATLNVLLGTQVRYYCWKAHLWWAAVPVWKKVGKHCTWLGKIFQHMHQCWLNHVDSWNSVALWTIFAWGVFPSSVCRLFLL